jgi:hypothetical protein
MSNIFKRFGLIFFILVIVFITYVYFTEGEKKEPPARVEKKEKASQLITAKA